MYPGSGSASTATASCASPDGSRYTRGSPGATTSPISTSTSRTTPPVATCTGCCIFIDSSTTADRPAATGSPTVTSIAVTTPAIGAVSTTTPSGATGSLESPDSRTRIARLAEGGTGTPRESEPECARVGAWVPASRGSGAGESGRPCGPTASAPLSATSRAACSSTKRVCIAPPTNASSARIALCSARFVGTPSIAVSRSAASARRRAPSNPERSCTTTFASSESKRGLIRCPVAAAVSTRTPAPVGRSSRVTVPGCGTTVPSGRRVSALIRIWIAHPAGAGTWSWVRPSAAGSAPAATSSWARTRSMPRISSVTVCSTCRRGLTSRKKNVPSAATRNSTVARPR